MGANDTHSSTNGASPTAAHELTTFPRVELETYVQTGEGYIFRAVFRDTSLADAVAALQRKGCTPAAPVARSAPTSNGKGNKSKAQRVDPVYNGDGDPCCPTHRRALKEGQWGLYCSAKDQATGEYCKLKFNE